MLFVLLVIGVLVEISYTGQCQNGGTCSPNNFTCTCTSEYTGENCDTAINPCDSNPCNSKETCLLTGGLNFTCTCLTGFTGHNYSTQMTTVLMKTVYMEHVIICYTCVCLTGYTGLNCEIDIDECATADCGEGTCQDEVGTYSCVCLAGFTGLNCEENIDDCVGVNCDGNRTCQDMVDSYACVCQVDYIVR